MTPKRHLPPIAVLTMLLASSVALLPLASASHKDPLTVEVVRAPAPLFFAGHASALLEVSNSGTRPVEAFVAAWTDDGAASVRVGPTRLKLEPRSTAFVTVDLVAAPAAVSGDHELQVEVLPRGATTGAKVDVEYTVRGIVRLTPPTCCVWLEPQPHPDPCCAWQEPPTQPEPEPCCTWEPTPPPDCCPEPEPCCTYEPQPPPQPEPCCPYEPQPPPRPEPCCEPTPPPQRPPRPEPCCHHDPRPTPPPSNGTRSEGAFSGFHGAFNAWLETMELMLRLGFEANATTPR